MAGDRHMKLYIKKELKNSVQVVARSADEALSYYKGYYQRTGELVSQNGNVFTIKDKQYTNKKSVLQ